MANIQNERPSSEEPDSGGILTNPFDKDVPTLLALATESAKRQAEQQAADRAVHVRASGRVAIQTARRA